MLELKMEHINFRDYDFNFIKLHWNLFLSSMNSLHMIFQYDIE